MLGTAVLRGRLEHLLATCTDQRVQAAAAAEPPAAPGGLAALLIGLWLAQRGGGGGGGGVGRTISTQLRMAGVADLAEALLLRVRAPLFSHPASGSDAADRLAVEWSLPRWLAAAWVEQLGVERATSLGKAMVERARVTLRANLLKVTNQPQS